MSDTRTISRSPIELLMREHELLNGLLEAYEDLIPAQIQEKEELGRRIQEEIFRHVGTEEALFYPTLMELKDTRIHELIGEVLAEHRELEALAAELQKAGPGPKANLIVTMIRPRAAHHMKNEELEVFPFAWGLPRETLNQMGLEMEERRTR